MVTSAEQYIRAIRNPAKRAYAIRYLAYLRGEGNTGDGPDYPGLSRMGAQAVRMALMSYTRKAPDPSHSAALNDGDAT